ncbi:unnamed protein product [Darwinula stevensoni]|uniref:Uncharacterized protein n=1 Tax=Darwinula stevensoni TaxID=69355 RepID=A0A7R8XGJ4_9CRUS|nr:unnamed protein product [Darwinula stevensoni]CAG0896075.1 unnamed protein product [Darwinula stevensoni]
MKHIYFFSWKELLRKGPEPNAMGLREHSSPEPRNSSKPCSITPLDDFRDLSRDEEKMKFHQGHQKPSDSTSQDISVIDLPLLGTPSRRNGSLIFEINSGKRSQVNKTFEVLLTGTSIESIGDFLTGFFNVTLGVTSKDTHRYGLEKVLRENNDIVLLESTITSSIE